MEPSTKPRCNAGSGFMQKIQRGRSTRFSSGCHPVVLRTQHAIKLVGFCSILQDFPRSSEARFSNGFFSQIRLSSNNRFFSSLLARSFRLGCTQVSFLDMYMHCRLPWSERDTERQKHYRFHAQCLTVGHLTALGRHIIVLLMILVVILLEHGGAGATLNLPGPLFIEAQ